MQGLGNPVILCIDKKRSLPSDFVRSLCIFYGRPNYVSKLKTLLDDIQSLNGYYSNHLGDLALKVGDYEKAGRYYEERYLIGQDNAILRKLKRLIDNLEKDEKIPYSYKQRLPEGVKTYYAEIEAADVGSKRSVTRREKYGQNSGWEKDRPSETVQKGQARRSQKYRGRKTSQKVYAPITSKRRETFTKKA